MRSQTFKIKKLHSNYSILKMGKKDKKKKAGKGAEKTALKTQKKLKNKLLKLTGEVRLIILNFFL